LKPKFGNQKLVEITHEDLRALTDTIVERGAPATAVHVREVVMQVFRWAIERGQKVENPADMVRPTTIAKFEPRDRALTPDEIGLMYQYMERIGTTPSIRAAAKLLLLTMVRKSELTNATWSEINFSEALWTVPKERMKRRNPHHVYLSRQALDIFIALKAFAGGSEYVLPSRMTRTCQLGGQVRTGQHALHLGVERRPDLARGHIDGEPERLPCQGLPLVHLAAGFVQHPRADFRHQAGRFGQRYELTGWQQSQARMPPAQQRFRAGNPVIAQIDDWLVMQLKLSARRRLRQLGRRPSCKQGSGHNFSLKARSSSVTARTNKAVSASAATPQCSPRKAPAVVPASTAARIGRWQGQVSTASTPHR